MKNTFTERELRRAIREILLDPRFSMQRFSDERKGDAYRRLGDNAGIGFQFEMEKPVRGPVRRTKSHLGWFVFITVNGHGQNIYLNLDQIADYAAIAEAVEQFTEILD